jgi:hypothetical protein
MALNSTSRGDYSELLTHVGDVTNSRRQYSSSDKQMIAGGSSTIATLVEQEWDEW